MENKFSNFSSNFSLKTIGTVSEFLTTLRKSKYTMVNKGGAIAEIGNKGTPQICFVNDEGRNVILRASQNLWNRLINNEQIDIMALPIFDLGVDGIPELVIGLTGLEDMESVPSNLSKDQLHNLFGTSFSNNLKK